MQYFKLNEFTFFRNLKNSFDRDREQKNDFLSIERVSIHELGEFHILEKTSRCFGG